MGSIDNHPTSIKGFIGYDRNLPVQKIAGTIARYRNGFERQLTVVHDIRSRQEDFTLDVHGFQFLRAGQLGDISSDKHDWNDPTYIKSTIYTETQDLLRQATGASRVHCYSHLVRQKPLSAIQAICDDKSVPDTHLTSLSVPSPAVHIDHSAKGSWEVLEDNLPAEEAEDVATSGKRWAIINLWRPIKTVHRDPLCICDARTVDEQDLVPQRIYLPKSATSTFRDVSRGKSFESVGVRPNPRHDWYYCSEMTPHEALLIKIHDSAASAPGTSTIKPTAAGSRETALKGDGSSRWLAGGVPHTSLQIPDTEALEPRESIELRCLLFWD